MIFALLCAAACAALGHLAARRRGQRLETVLAWEEALARLEEGARRGYALTELLDSCGNVPALRAAAAALDRAPAMDAEAWLSSLPWESLLLPGEKETLRRCLRGLLLPRQDMQCRAVGQARETWRRVVEACRREAEEGGRLCRRLGWLGGAAAFILLC